MDLYCYAGTHAFFNLADDPELFAAAREARGIVFAGEEIVSRPYHKFFNAGEHAEYPVHVPEEHIIRDGVVLEKLDGSMIAGVQVGNSIFWGTKMWADEFHHEISQFDDGKYEEFAKQANRDGYTPIFEWVSPKRKIVIPYEKENLILTGMRHKETGAYLPYEDMVSYAGDIPVVQQCSKDDLMEALNGTDREDMEGYVVRHPDGEMLKVKLDWYVAVHEYASSRKAILKAIHDDKIDDVISILNRYEATRSLVAEVEALTKDFGKFVQSKVDEIVGMVEDRKHMSRKEFALDIQGYDKYWKPVLFQVRTEQENGGNLVLLADKLVRERAGKILG
ncbi:MAG: hypothetical protein D6698_15165 [Gammaproteobacteria bacterium]|nr:MAG: hypothetical protein D6698_15165 [Gammaproteobacteria bacterium]